MGELSLSLTLRCVGDFPIREGFPFNEGVPGSSPSVGGGLRGVLMVSWVMTEARRHSRVHIPGGALQVWQ